MSKDIMTQFIIPDFIHFVKYVESLKWMGSWRIKFAYFSIISKDMLDLFIIF